MDVLTDLAAQLGKLLAARKLKVTTAESCTGGGVAEAITRIAGSSAWFEVGYVTYSNHQKSQMLGVPHALLVEKGAVSSEVALAMALGALQASGADLSVALTGIAGPGGAEPNKPVGTVWIAWQFEQQTHVHGYHFSGDRLEVRHQAVMAALQGLIALCQGRAPV